MNTEQIERMYERIAPLVEKMRAKYPQNLDGLEPALTSDIADICLEIERDTYLKAAEVAKRLGQKDMFYDQIKLMTVEEKNAWNKCTEAFISELTSLGISSDKKE